MSAYELMQQVIQVLSTIEGVDVCETYPQEQVAMPLSNATMTVDVSSGGISKSVITLSAYMPESQGSDTCRELIEQARTKLTAAGLAGFQEFEAKSIGYEKVARAYLQQANVSFELPETATIISLTFGQETISALDDTKLNYGRNLSMYYSPIAGAQVQDLGANLRKVSGSTIPDAEQFERLSELVQSGDVKLLSLNGESFQAVLSSLSGLAQGKVKFEFTEVSL